MSDKRRVLVTGASGGIGAAIARALHGMGFPLCLHFHRNAAKAEALAKQLGGARTLGFDLRDRDGARTALEGEIGSRGAFWGVVCNAGVTADNTFAALSGTDWDKVVDTNLGGFYNVVNPLLMPLVRLRDGGRIVTIASVSGLMGNRGQVNYSAAKAGLIGASKALAVELASRKITVNCVAPGLIEIDMTGEHLPLEEILKQIPLGRAGTTAEVAAWWPISSPSRPPT
jgi:3-oxoacyl-[acyl-carrier protein] reductase